MFPSNRDTPAAARRFVRHVVRQSGLNCRVDDLELLVSEVVTNAILHGGGSTLSVTVSDDGDVLRVGVTDPSPDHPVVRHPSPDRPNGRGMLLVDRIATRWGTELLADDAKRVWFECSG